MSVVRLAAKYLRYAGTIYKKHGRRTTSMDCVLYAMRSLRDHHGSEVADEMTNPKLARLRDQMIRSTVNGRTRVLAVNTVNGRLESIKAAYRLARERGWVSAATLQDVLAVSRLRAGRCEAAPAGKVKPVHRNEVELTLAVLPPLMRDMVELLWLTGMRPGEACLLRPCDIDTTGTIWVYSPKEFKTEHLEGARPRKICLGPKSQEILRSILPQDLAAYVFDPRISQAQRLELKRAGRKTPAWPSHMKRHKAEPTAALSTSYNNKTLRRAIHYACHLAGIQAWNPNQLRHAHATRVFKELGLNEASKSLGHTDLGTTMIYAERDLDIAKDVARRLG